MSVRRCARNGTPVHFVALVFESSSDNHYESHIRLTGKVFIIFSHFLSLLLSTVPPPPIFSSSSSAYSSLFLLPLRKNGGYHANNYHINFEAQRIRWHEEYVKIYLQVGRNTLVL